MTRQNKRQPLLLISGGVAAGGVGGGGLLLVSRGTEAVTQTGLPPDVIADAGYATIAAGALAFVVHMVSRLLRLSHERKEGLIRLSQEQEEGLLRLSQEQQAGQRMLDTASTFEEFEKVWLHFQNRGNGSAGDGASLDDGDRGAGAGQA